MKKYLFLMIALVGLAGISGCSKTEIVERAVLPNRTFIYTVNANQWKLNDNGTISHDIQLPELTDYYLKEGFVSVAMSEDGEESYDILPSTYGGIAYSVNYTVGFVTIIGQDPIIDPEISVPAPSSTITFKVVLSDSEFIE